MLCLDERSYKPFTFVVDSFGYLGKTVRGLVDHLENSVIGLEDNERLRREWESRVEERLMQSRAVVFCIDGCVMSSKPNHERFSSSS